VLYSAVHYPADYGFVPQTRSSDGELLDAMVMVERTTFPGCLIEARLLGVLTIRRPDGEPEHKLLGVPVGEPRFEAYQDLSDVPKEMLNVIENFFDIYKELEHEDYDVLGWDGKERATEVLEAAMSAYREAAEEK
jgi:inorganic pyrophosphatase